MWIYVHIHVEVHIHTYLYEYGKRCGRIDLRYKQAMSIPHLDTFFLGSVVLIPALGWFAAKTSIMCDIEKTALRTGANPFLREPEILGSYMSPKGICTGLSIKTLLPDKICTPKISEKRWSLGLPLKLHPWLTSFPFLSHFPRFLMVSPGSKSLINHFHLNSCLRICFWQNLTLRHQSKFGYFGRISSVSIIYACIVALITINMSYSLI